jgi:hypothetical protein
MTSPRMSSAERAPCASERSVRTERAANQHLGNVLPNKALQRTRVHVARIGGNFMLVPHSRGSAFVVACR